MRSIRLVLSHAASFKWEVHQIDVISAFFHGDLHEEIYMEQPPDLSTMTLSLFVTLRNLFRVLSKPVMLGMPKYIF